MDKLRADAQAIWQAGVEAVRPERLFARKLRLTNSSLQIEEADFELDFTRFRRIVVVGAGKAAASMAEALHHSVIVPLRQKPAKGVANLQVTGWLNCPEGTIHSELPDIHLHPARPAGVNSPTEAAIHGTQRMLDLLSQCTSEDLVICLISGGGSALLVAPTQPLSLTDKQAVARLISSSGGSIEQLNAVRGCLSDVKGGGFARRCSAGQMLTLIISDVLGDPIDVIASGPTCCDCEPQPRLALNVLDELKLREHPELARVVDFLSNKPHTEYENNDSSRIKNVVLGNNSDAVDAAGSKAVELGYRYVMQSAQRSEGDVLEVAAHAAQAIEQMLANAEIDCWISGGEPTVALPKAVVGKGGRNQQLALAVLNQTSHLLSTDRDCVFYSGGTDGEDGPTDAAGAWFDAEIARRSEQLNLIPQEYLSNADAYNFFRATDSLIQTGPTGTNVCDLRVALTSRPKTRSESD